MKLLQQTIPDCFFCLSESEKQQYVYDILFNPLSQPSFLFSSFYYVIKMKTKETSSSTHLLLFQKFLSLRIVPLLVEITSTSRRKGNDMILQKEFYESIMCNLLHVCDVVSNNYPSIRSSFFLPGDFSKWLSEAIIRVFFCYGEDCDPVFFSSFLTKCCILNYSTNLANSFYHVVQLIERMVAPVSSEERLICIQNKGVMRDISSQFISVFPSLRYTDFFTQILTLFFTQPNPVPSSPSYYIDSPAIILFALYQTTPFLSIILHQSSSLKVFSPSTYCFIL